MANALRLATSQALSLAEAKAHFSSVVSEVQQTRTPVTILKRGVPVAAIVPVSKEERTSGYGCMRGTVRELGDVVGPTGKEWALKDEES